MAFSLLEPFGSPREDYRFGMLAAQVLEPHRRHGRPFKPTDFFPEYDHDEEDDWQDMKAQMATFAFHNGGKPNEGKYENWQVPLEQFLST